VNQVTFAWWGAEEEGLLGSEYYASQLTPTQLADIACYYNFDMTGSPNGVRYVFNSTNYMNTTNLKNASLTLATLLTDYFDSTQLPWTRLMNAFGSDYYTFSIRGVPSGGIATGASGIKSAADRLMYGGLAETAYDPCYHRYCDTVQNIDLNLFHTNSLGAASALQTLAFSDISGLK
jgi:Zn-dependent M28 family amino/carboxypeptidase